MCVKHTTEIILTQPNQTPRHGPINTASCGHHKISINVKISNLKISLIINSNKKQDQRIYIRGIVPDQCKNRTKQCYVLSKELQAVILRPYFSLKRILVMSSVNLLTAN